MSGNSINSSFQPLVSVPFMTTNKGSKWKALCWKIVQRIQTIALHFQWKRVKVIRSKTCLHVFLASIFCLVIFAIGWCVTQKVWDKYAQHRNLESFCSSNTLGEPNRVCLIGMPYYDRKDFISYGIEDSKRTIRGKGAGKGKKHSCCENHTDVCTGEAMAENVIASLNTSIEREPQELRLMGSLPGNETCVEFHLVHSSNKKIWTKQHWSEQYFPVGSTDVTPHDKKYTNNSWCLNIIGSEIKGHSRTRLVHTKGSQRRALPYGYFLICGNRAWQGIPARAKGGPCYLGKLTNYTQSMKNHVWWSTDNNALEHWNVRKLLLSVFVPVGVQLIQMLNYGVMEQLVTIVKILNDFFAHVNEIQQVILQNRKALNYLLKIHGHTCNEFEGMCNAELATHSKEVHAKIQMVNNNFHKQKDGISSLEEETSSLSISKDALPEEKGFVFTVTTICLVAIANRIGWLNVR